VLPQRQYLTRRCSLRDWPFLKSLILRTGRLADVEKLIRYIIPEMYLKWARAAAADVASPHPLA